jgi:hypothetical protein
MERWVDAGLIRVDYRPGEDCSVVFEPQSVYINESLMLKCTPEDVIQT